MPAKITVGDDLSLQRTLTDDAEDLFQIIEDAPEIKQNVTWPASVNSVEDVRQSIRYLLKEDKYQPYTLRENNRTIGYMGTWNVKDNDHEIGFSYFLAKSKRGHGHVTRALLSLMQTVKENLPIDMFVVNIIDGNEPSRAIADRLGFKATDKLIRDNTLQAMIRRYERPT